MKIKWLVILSLVCAGIIYLTFMLTKQNTETQLPPQEKTAGIEQAENYLQPLPPAPLNLITKSAPAAIKSAITIISKPPAAEPEKQVVLPSIASDENFSPNSETGNNTRPGITKIGKYPSKKEVQEMQSKGIVLY